MSNMTPGEAFEKILAELTEMKNVLSAVLTAISELEKKQVAAKPTYKSGNSTSNSGGGAPKWTSEILDEACPECGGKLKKIFKDGTPTFIGCENFKKGGLGCSYSRKV